MSTAALSLDGGAGQRMSRDQMILRYAPLVRHTVGSLAIPRRADLETEDLYGYGTMGLIDAVDRFDASRGVKFETYAATRIRGYLIDQLRALDWLPRIARMNVRVVQHTSARLEESLGRMPDRDELVRETGLPVEACDRALIDSTCRTVSLDNLCCGDEESVPLTLLQRLQDEQSPNPAQAAERHELLAGVRDALYALPEREQGILCLRYEQHLTHKQIAERLAISESRVSQLHAQALNRMRRILSERFEDLANHQLSA